MIREAESNAGIEIIRLEDATKIYQMGICTTYKMIIPFYVIPKEIEAARKPPNIPFFFEENDIISSP